MSKKLRKRQYFASRKSFTERCRLSDLEGWVFHSKDDGQDAGKKGKEEEKQRLIQRNRKVSVWNTEFTLRIPLE